MNNLRNIKSMDHFKTFTRQIPCAVVITALVLAGCSSEPKEPEPADQPPVAAPAGYRVYVTNERSDDLSVIDPATHEVVATIPLGKRPRGIHASPDGKTIYVA